MAFDVKRVETVRCGGCGHEVNVRQRKPLSSFQCPECDAKINVPVSLGPLFISKPIGQGTSGVVYQAVDQKLNRPVAVKILKNTQHSDRQRTEDCLTEARAMASISHPNVVQIHRIGDNNNQPYIEMEMMSGGTVRELIRKQGSLDEAHALEVAVGVAKGLRAALRAGLVHRDVKPENILLDSAGTAKIHDFGVATKKHGESDQQVVGTPYYVAPEVIRQHPFDHRADIYSLGCTLYHMLAGQVPFEDAKVSGVYMAHLKRTPPDLNELRPELHPETIDLVRHMMQREAHDRPQTYDTLIEEMEHTLAVAQGRIAASQQRVAADLRNAVAGTARPGGGRLASAHGKRRGGRQGRGGHGAVIVAGVIGVAILAVALALLLHAVSTTGASEDTPPVDASANAEGDPSPAAPYQPPEVRWNENEPDSPDAPEPEGDPSDPAPQPAPEPQPKEDPTPPPTPKPRENPTPPPSKPDPPQVTLQTGLVLHWAFESNFEDTAGVRTAHPGHHAGNAAVFDAGRVGKSAAHFNGQSVVYHSACPGIKAIRSDLSVSIWVKLPTGQSQQPQAVLVGKGERSWSLGLAGSSPDELRFMVAVDASSEAEVVVKPPALDDGRWHHLVAVKDGAALRLYVDGEELGSAANAAAQLVLDDAPIGVGGRVVPAGENQISADRRIVAHLDDLRLYDRPLAADEVKALMTQAGPDPAGPPPDLAVRPTPQPGPDPGAETTPGEPTTPAPKLHGWTTPANATFAAAEGGVEITVNEGLGVIESPPIKVAPQSGATATLAIEIAPRSDDDLRLWWATPERPDFDLARSKRRSMLPNGELRRYTITGIPLGAGISRLRLQLARARGPQGNSAVIKSIRLLKDDAPNDKPLAEWSFE